MNKPTLWQRYKNFMWTYLKESPWYLWILRITAALLIAYILIKALHL
ncbi:MAG: hypothetical protein ACK4UR_00550 [Caldimicrobium sp.]